MPRAPLLAAVVFFAVAASPRAARAEEPRALRNTSTGFLALETLGVVSVFAAYSIGAGDPATKCSWCRAGAFDERIRTWLRASDSKRVGFVSHAYSVGFTGTTALVGVVVPAVGAGRPEVAAKDAWIVANAFVLATGLADGTKKLADRRRPAWTHGRGGATEASPVEENLSFFSGDTAWAFSLAASSTTLSALHGYPSTTWLGVGTGFLAGTAGVLRIAADMHWATDVLAGAVVGTGVGVGLPLAFHRRAAPTGVSLMFTPGGLAASGVF